MLDTRLVLYNAFPRVYDSLASATSDLQRIGSKGLGFNAIWLNPLNMASNGEVSRYNVNTFQSQNVTASLYATYDFARLNHDLFPDLNSADDSLDPGGNPGYATDHEKKLMRQYTDEARSNGMRPIFDLVLNHVAKDSPLVTGECQHFKRLGIDTSKWFVVDTEQHWDDIVPFDYSKPEIRKEIVEHLWKPYIEKYVKDFGFMGVRVDFATGFSPELQRELYPILNMAVRREFPTEKTPLIFAECLPPKGLDKIAQEYRELYTHTTNNTNWTLGNAGHDIGTKQQLTHLKENGEQLSRKGGGSLGFAASHDDGPASWNAMEHLVETKIDSDDYLRHLHYEVRDDKKKRQQLFQRVTNETLTDMLDTAALSGELAPEVAEAQKQAAMQKDEWIHLMKKRLAITSMCSDGGYYLMSGDEFADPTPKSVFATSKGTSLYHEAENFSKQCANPTVDLTVFIRNLNHAISEMSPAVFPHWTNVVEIEPNLVVVIGYNGEGFSEPELSIVNIGNGTVEISDELIEKIARQHSQDHGNNEDAYQAVKSAKIFIVGEANCEKLSARASVFNDTVSNKSSADLLAHKSAHQEVLATEVDSKHPDLSDNSDSSYKV